MGKDANKNKCAHPACTCTPAKGSRYCSEYCKDTKGSLELNCNCRHAGCGERAATAG